MTKVLALGELLLRYSTQPGERLKNARQLDLNYGGAEVNVAVSLANFNVDVEMATVLPDNPLGLAAKQHLNKYGISTKKVIFEGNRLGAYFVDSGVGNRPSQVTYDRQFSAMALIKTMPWKMDELFEGVDLFHISGITPGVSKELADLFVTLAQEAKRRGIKISFDVNYRGKMWTQVEACKVYERIFPLVDYCSAGRLDAYYFMGIPRKSEDIAYYYEEMSKKYPNIKVFYSTKREVISASENKLQGTLWINNQLFESKTYHIDNIVDRIGGGDAYSSGILKGILTQQTPQNIVDFATAATVLKHTVIGDCNEFSVQEVQTFLDNGSGAIIR